MPSFQSFFRRSLDLGDKSYGIDLKFLFSFCLTDFCPSQTKFNLKWNRTSVGTVVYRNCSNVESNLEGKDMVSLFLNLNSSWSRYASVSNCSTIFNLFVFVSWWLYQGQFSSRCTESSSRTSWKHKASCDCEKQAILQRVRLKVKRLLHKWA